MKKVEVLFICCLLAISSVCSSLHVHAKSKELVQEESTTKKVVENKQNIALGKPVETVNGKNPNLAVDGIIEEGNNNWWEGYMFHNGNADWTEKGEPYNPKGYLTIDLEGLYEIDEFKVYGYWEDQRSFAYNISTSTDGITFTQIVDKKIDDGKNNISNGISHKVNKTLAQYIRIQITDSNAQWPCSSQLREIEVFGVEKNEQGGNVALGKEVIDVTTHQKVNGLTDENSSTSAKIVKNHTLDLDLKDIYQLDNIQIYSDATSKKNVSYILKGSKDGKSYKVLERNIIKDSLHKFDIKKYKGMHLKLTFFDDITLHEIKAYGVSSQLISDSVNIALNKSIVGTNTEANRNAEFAVDGNINSYWAASSIGSYITVDLGDFYELNKFNVVPYFDNQRAYKYTISISKDGKHFHSVASKNDDSIATESGTNHVIEPQIARYVRLTMTDHLFSDNKSVHVNEFKVFGKEIDYELENIAYGKNISSNAGNLINDNYFDNWTAPTVEEEVVLDLGESYSINEISLFASEEQLNQYSIYASEDGKNYDIITQKSNNGNITIPFSFLNTRYLKIKSNSKDKTLSFNEIVIYGEKTPVATDGDIAFLKPVRTNFGMDNAENITDQEATTLWSGQYYPCYVDIDLMGTYNVDKAKIYMSNANGYYRYSIYTSKDGEKFNRVYRKDDKDTISKDGVMEADLTGAEGVRFVRIQFEYSSDTQNIGVNDIRLYGNKISSQKEYRDELTYTKFDDTKYAKDITDQEVYDYVNGLITRLFGEQYVDWFTFELKDKDAKKDFFEIYDENGKIHIAGNEGLSLTSGLYYYLKNYENVLVTEVEIQGNLTSKPNKVNATKGNPIRKENLYDVRYAYNYCTNSYTMAFFGEDEWQRELDWLALNGVNVVLDLNGQEAVWHNFLKKAGYSDEEAKDWLAGPGYYAWQFMANLETFNGPVSNDWILQRLEMARKNQYKMRILGMEPVYQAYSGEVPTNIKEFDPNIDIVPQKAWSAFDRPSMIRTTSQSYEKYSKLFYESQKEILGDNTHYYATDPFHEGGSVGDMNLADIGNIIFHKLREHHSDAVWVIQSWSLNQQTISKLTEEERKNGLLVLDLNADQDPKWKGDEFGGSPWVWCVLDNYGGKHGIQAELELMSTLYSDVYKNAKHMKGIGIAPEGTRLNTVQYDLLYETAWENENIDLKEWLKKYVLRRYGIKNEKDIPNAEKAWDILRTTVYKAHKQGEVYAAPDTIINFSPRFNIDKCWPWGRDIAAIYDQKQFEEATEYLFEDYEQLKDNDGYKFDATDMLREYLSNTAMQYYEKFTEAYKKNDAVAFNYFSDRFLSVIDMTDKVLNTHPEFLVGNWIEKAKDLGFEYNEDEFSKDMLERNARALITTWGSYRMAEQEYNHEGTSMWGQGVLVDYANRQYAGLTKDYYGKRWEIWINNLKDSFGQDYKDYTFKENFELGWNWVLDKNNYSTEPSGDIKKLAEETFLNYGLDDDYRLKINVVRDDGEAVEELYVHDGINQKIEVSLNEDEFIKVVEGKNIETKIENNTIIVTDITANTEINVVIEKKEMALNKDKLDQLIKDTHDLDSNQFTKTSWELVAQMLLEAKDVLNNAKTQEEIDSAYRKLNSALDGLEKKADISVANKFLKEVEKYNEDLFTSASWHNFARLRNRLQEMVKDVSDINQSQLDQALEAAKKAEKDLIYKKADYSAVDAAVAKAKALNPTDYVDFSGIEKALAAVKYDLDITKQAEVDGYAKAINDAIEALERKPVDPQEPVNKEDLQEAVDKASKLEKEDYTEESWKVFEEAYTNAKDVLSNEEATAKEVEEAKNALSEAIEQLKPVETKPIAPEEPEKPNKGDSTNTGDHTNAITYAALLAGSGLLLGGILLNKRRRGE